MAKDCPSDGTLEQHVFVMRHGERQDGVYRDWWKTAKRPYDTPLSSRGHSETRKLVQQRLAHKVGRLDRDAKDRGDDN